MMYPFNFQDPEALQAFEFERNWRFTKMVHGADEGEMRAYELGFLLGYEKGLRHFSDKRFLDQIRGERR